MDQSPKTRRTIFKELPAFIVELVREATARLIVFGRQFLIFWSAWVALSLIGLLIGPNVIRALAALSLGLATALFVLIVGMGVTKLADLSSTFRRNLPVVSSFLIPFFLLALSFVAFPMDAGISAILRRVLTTLMIGVMLAVYSSSRFSGRVKIMATIFGTLSIASVTLPALFPESIGAMGTLQKWFDETRGREIRKMAIPSSISVNHLHEFRDLDLFDGAGEPLIWFSQLDGGDYKFFSSSGFSPQTGRELAPLTPEMIPKIETYFARLEQDRRKKNEDTAATLRKRAQKAATEHRASELRLLLNDPSTKTRFDIALDVRSSSSLPGTTFDPGTVLANEIRKRLVNVSKKKLSINSSFFSESFRTTEHFSNVFKGNGSLLKEMDVFSRVNYVILGEVNAQCNRNESFQDMFGCRLSLSFKVFDSDHGLVDSGLFQTTGAGFTKDEALKRGLEQIAEQHGSEILAKPGSR